MPKMLTSRASRLGRNVTLWLGEHDPLVEVTARLRSTGGADWCDERPPSLFTRRWRTWWYRCKGYSLIGGLEPRWLRLVASRPIPVSNGVQRPKRSTASTLSSGDEHMYRGRSSSFGSHAGSVVGSRALSLR